MKSFNCPHCHKVFKSDSNDSEIVLCPHCNGTVSLPEKDLVPGTVVGGFEIIRLLGRGGMGNVYLAKQVSMERLVALKILLKSLTRDKESLEQFLNEARVSGSLNHANIISAIDAGEIDGTYYLATAYVEGEDLEQRLEKVHFIPEEDALRIAIKIGNALNYAWEAYGLLHKDIKPGNIMCDKKGEVYLMDMGIAQYIGEGSGGEEHILGSPFYMSPEQTTASRLSWTSDLYSLGASLYNMIVGVPPYDATEVMRIIEMHSTEPFPEPITRNPAAEVSKPTVELLKKMMAKKPQDRFDSWTGFIEAAENALRAIDPRFVKKKTTGKFPKTTTASLPRKKPAQKPGKKPNKKRSGKKPLTPIVHKQSNPAASIITYLLLIIIAAGITFLIYDYRKKTAAEEAFNRAQRFMSDHPGEYDSIIDQYYQARFKCQGTVFEQQVDAFIETLKKEKIRQKQLVAQYKVVRKTADQLAANRNYSQAMEMVLNASRDIKDPSIVKEAEMAVKFYKNMATEK